MGSTFEVSSLLSLPMYSRISSSCARYVSSSASLRSKYASSATRNTSSREIFICDSLPAYSFGRFFQVLGGNVVIGQFLEGGTGGAATAGTGGDAGGKGPQPEGLQEFAAGVHFFAPVAAGTRCERDANRVADALVQKDAQRRCRPHHTFHAHARFGQAEVQGLAGFARQIAIDGNQVARARGFAGDDDLVGAQTRFEGKFGGFERGKHHTFVNDFFRLFAKILVGILLHFAHHQLLIEGTAIHTDAHGLAVIDGHFADGGELLVTTLSGAHISGIDAVLVERLGACGVFGQQHVAVVVEVADDGHVATGVEQPLLDERHRFGGFRNVDGPADDFRAGFGEFDALPEGSIDVGRVGIGHGLDDNGSAAADLNVADFYAVSFFARLAQSSRVSSGNLVQHIVIF